MPCTLCFETGHNRRTCTAWHVIASQLDPLQLDPRLILPHDNDNDNDNEDEDEDEDEDEEFLEVIDPDNSIAFQWLVYIVATHFDLELLHTYNILSTQHTTNIYNIVSQLSYQDLLFDASIDSGLVESELEEGIRCLIEVFVFPNGYPNPTTIVKRLRNGVYFNFITKLEEYLLPIIQIEDPVITLAPIVASPCHSDECPICMESLLKTDLFTTRCGHMFHGSCMITHLKHKNSCPMCRGILSL